MIVKERDEAMIRAVTTHAGVWPFMAGMDEHYEFEVPDGDWYSLVRDGAKVGFLAFLPEDGFRSVHIGVLPDHRGPWVEGAVKAALGEQGGKLKVRVRHHRTYALAYRVGFRRTGMDADGWIDMELTK